MLGFAPIAAAPFGAPGDAGAFFDVSFEDAAEASSNVLARAVFPNATPEEAAAEDGVLVAPSVFGALIDEESSGSSAESSLAVFLGSIPEGVSSTASFVAQVIFPVSVSNTASASDAEAALATFIASVSETASAQDSAAALLVYEVLIEEMAASAMAANAVASFNANVAEVASGLDAVGSSVIFLAQTSDSASGAMIALVAPSVFNAVVLMAANASDGVNAGAIMNGGIVEGVTAEDAAAANFLWNIINNAQPTNWTVVKTQN